MAEAQTADQDPQPGFEYVPRAPFVNHVGPIYQGVGTAPGQQRLGLRVAEVHCNTMGFMHGGMIATMADSAMARALFSKLQRRTVTLKMSMEYLDTVNRHDWLVAEARLVSHDETAAYTECDIKVGDSLRARATGVFRLLRKK